MSVTFFPLSKLSAVMVVVGGLRNHARNAHSTKSARVLTRSPGCCSQWEVHFAFEQSPNLREGFRQPARRRRPGSTVLANKMARKLSQDSHLPYIAVGNVRFRTLKTPRSTPPRSGILPGRGHHCADAGFREEYNSSTLIAWASIRDCNFSMMME